jgi:hypothetical protein
MVTVLQPGGPWAQASAACFFLGGIFADILLIRVFLFMAYTFLLTQALCGLPPWPYYEANGTIELSAVVWSCMNLIVHGAAIWRLLYDERPIKFKTKDELQMANFLLRRGGMQPLEAKEVIRKGRFNRIRKGEHILDRWDCIDRAILLIDGKAHYNKASSQGERSSANIYSGMIFDIGLFNVFGVYIGFEKEGVNFEVVADTDCLVFEWNVFQLDDLACRCGPAVSSFCRNFILYQVASEWEFRVHAEPHGKTPRASRGDREFPDIFQGGRSRDFTEPLEDWEVRKTTIKGFFKWLWVSLAPFMPLGTRHTALPVSGINAKTRILKIEDVQKRVMENAPSRLDSANASLEC